MDNFIIEVKTNWIKKDDFYTRDIIEYQYAPKEEKIINNLNNFRFIEFYKSSSETKKTITSNNLEISAKNIIDNKLLTEPNELIATLLDYMKYKWEIEE